MAGYEPDWLTVFLLAGFHMQDSAGRTGERGAARAAAAFFCIFLAVSVLPRQNMEVLMGLPLQLQQRISARFGGKKENDPGLVSRGNLLLSGADALEITVSRKPEQTMYLKSFTGGNYREGRWTAADETDFYRQVRLEGGRYSSYYAWPRYFERRQYEWVRYGKWEEWQQDGKIWDPATYAQWENEMMIAVEDLSGRDLYYQPYFSAYWSETRNGYQFSAYDMAEYFYYAGKADSVTAEWFRGLEAPYRKYAAQTYLETPRDGLTRLAVLAGTHPDGDEEQITEWILKTLWSRAVYTRTPGIIPLGMDAAEYLLFEGGRGYCQHFATAAVLLYRMCGIPARYAAGYVAETGDFIQQEDGSWQAVLTDESAHAWAEIYTGDYGWIPVEVTPPDNGAVPAPEENPEETGMQMLQAEEETADTGKDAGQEAALRENGDAISETEQDGAETSENAGEEKNGGREEPSGRESTWSDQNTGWRVILGGGGCAAAVSLGMVLWLCRRRRTRRMPARSKEIPADTEFYRLVELLHWCGFMKDYKGTEPDFSRQLCRKFPSLKEAETALAVHTAMKESFSKEGISKEERRQAEEFFEQVRCILAAETSGPKGIWLRLWFQVNPYAPAADAPAIPQKSGGAFGIPELTPPNRRQD